MKTKSFNLNRKALVCLCLLVLAAAGITTALAFYIGSSDPVENTFTIVAGGNGDVGNIDEPSWNPENAENLEPGDTVAKDPSFSFTGEYDAWVFMKVEVPVLEASLDSVPGVYDAVVIDEPLGAGWSLAASSLSSEPGTPSVYFYAYDTVLSRGEKTSALFESFTVQDFTEISEDFTSSLNVSASVYQAETSQHGGYTQEEALAAFLGN